VNRPILTLPGSLGLAVLALVSSAAAQNLLTNNAGFEANSAYYTPGWGWPQGSPVALPGWVMTLDPAGDGYAGAANNQSPLDIEGANFGYIYSGTGSSGLLETAPGSRAPVQAGLTYTLWFLARGDASWGETLATVSLIWHSNQTNGPTVGEAATLDMTLPVRLSTDDSMRTFHITAVAPQGAQYAGARVTRPPNDYAPLLVDDFVIMTEPAQVSLFMKKEGPNVVISWTRDIHHELQENSDIAITGGWRKSAKPIKGVGAINQVVAPLTENALFYRLAAPG